MLALESLHHTPKLLQKHSLHVLIALTGQDTPNMRLPSWLEYDAGIWHWDVWSEHDVWSKHDE